MALDGSPLVLTQKEGIVIASSVLSTLLSSSSPVPHDRLVETMGKWREKFFVALDDSTFLPLLSSGHDIHVHRPHGENSWTSAMWEIRRKTPLDILHAAPEGCRAMSGADIMKYDNRQPFVEQLLHAMADRHVMWLPHTQRIDTIERERYHVVVWAETLEAKERVMKASNGFRAFKVFVPSPGDDDPSTSSWCFYFGGCHWTSDEVHNVARKSYGGGVTMRLFATRASEAPVDLTTTRPTEVRVIMLQTLWILRRWELDPPSDLISGFKRCEEIIHSMDVCCKERLQLEKALLTTRSSFADKVTFVAASMEEKKGVWSRGDIGTDGERAMVLFDDDKGDWLQPKRLALPPLVKFATLAQTEDELSRLKSNPQSPQWVYALLADVGDAVRGGSAAVCAAREGGENDHWANVSLEKSKRQPRKRRFDNKHNRSVLCVWMPPPPPPLVRGTSTGSVCSHPAFDVEDDDDDVANLASLDFVDEPGQQPQRMVRVLSDATLGLSPWPSADVARYTHTAPPPVETDLPPPQPQPQRRGGNIVAPLRRLGSSRIWELVVRATAVRSRSMPGFPQSSPANDGEVCMLEIDPTEEMVANAMIASGDNDIARVWWKGGNVFAHVPLEEAYMRYSGNRHGAPHERWIRRCIVAVVVVGGCSIALSDVWWPVTITLACLCACAAILPKFLKHRTNIWIADCSVGWLAMACVACAFAHTMNPAAALVNASVTVVAAHAFGGPPLRTAISVLVPSVVTGVSIVTMHHTEDDDAWGAWRTAVYFIILNGLLLMTAHSVDSSERQRYLFIIRARAEQKRSMALLRRLLPESVLQRMRAGTKIEPLVHASATVMFVELHDFDTNSQHAPHDVIIGLLNGIFGAFDDVVAKTNAFKVESVGPVYMVAANVLAPIHDHASVLLDIAKRFQSIAADRHMPTSTHASTPVQLRIGMHTGMLISGVIASKLPRYRLFGDTVNTASRMCSTCNPGEIQLSDSAFEELRAYAHPDVGSKALTFDLLERELVVKGKGTMHTHVLVVPKNAGVVVKLPATPQRVQRSASAMWGEACSPRVRRESSSPSPVPPSVHIPAFPFPSSTDALPCFAPPPSSILGPLTRPLSEDELRLPAGAEEYHKASSAAMHSVTLKFIRPQWLETLFVDSTNRSFAARMMRSTIVALIFFFTALLAMVANEALGVKGVSRNAMVVAGAFGVVGAASVGGQRTLRREMAEWTGLLALGGMAVAMGAILALPVFEWNGAPLTVVASTHATAVVVVALGASRCMRIQSMAMSVVMTIVVFGALVGTAISAEMVFLIVAGIATIGHAYTSERHSREDFLAGVVVHVERRAYHDIGCHLLPRIVMEALCVPPKTPSPCPSPTGLSPVASTTLSSQCEYSAHNKDVAILYADIVGFTALCSSMLPQTNIVTLLKDLYTAMDAAAERHHVCKLETIGDAYWAAANLPAFVEGDLHGDVGISGIASFALEVDEIARGFHGLGMRVGIASGEVATGVVGTISPRYHAFGPVVTAAQMMEKASVRGKVLVTPEFSIRLQLARKRLAQVPMFFYKAGPLNDRNSPLWLCEEEEEEVVVNFPQ